MSIEKAKEFVEDYSIDDISIFNRQNEHFFLYDLLEEYSKTFTPQPTNNGWISVEDRLPEMITGKDYSENVIVWLNEERKIMNYALLPDDNNNLCYAWCMVYDGLDGDAEFDDNYYPTHWQPLPPKP